jgi:hypothetical protein
MFILIWPKHDTNLSFQRAGAFWGDEFCGSEMVRRFVSAPARQQTNDKDFDLETAMAPANGGHALALERAGFTAWTC